MMWIGQVTLALLDQHQAMYFSLEMVLPSVGPAANSRRPQLPSPQLRRHMMQEFSYIRSYMATPFNERSWKKGGFPDCNLCRQPRAGKECQIP